MFKQSMIGLVLGSVVVFTGVAAASPAVRAPAIHEVAPAASVAARQAGDEQPATDSGDSESSTPSLTLEQTLREQVSRIEFTKASSGESTPEQAEMESETHCVIGPSKLYCCTWIGSSLGPICGSPGN